MKELNNVILSLSLIALLCGAVNAEEPQATSSMEQWIEDHTVVVKATNSYTYEEGGLIIKEVYTGTELKERFGIETFTKELEVPVEAKVVWMKEGAEKVFVTEKSVVLTSGDDGPPWWIDYNYPQWVWFKSGTIYELQDDLPINLAWKNTTKDAAKLEILNGGWFDLVDDNSIFPPMQYSEYVYDPVNGWVMGDGVATSRYGLGCRYHSNLWQMSDGNVVANAHHDTRVPHQVDELETAEELVAGFFAEPGWKVYDDSYYLDNCINEASEIEPWSNGLCTQISYGHATWYVPDDYATIQAAVNVAIAGDTIIVRDGTYPENVDVAVPDITIRSENGSALTTVEAANPADRVFDLSADHVNLTGFTMAGASVGICLTGASYCNIFNNTISNNDGGVHINSSSNNEISCNWVHHNNETGFYMSGGSTGNTIEKNNIIENGMLQGDGIYHLQFYNDQSDNVTATDNWWGTNNDSVINASIHDKSDDVSKGVVTHLPKLDLPAPCAPIPELMTIALCSIGLLALAGYNRFGRKDM